MVILDIGDEACYLFLKCDYRDGSDSEVVWSDYENEYYFTECQPIFENIVVYT